MIAFICDYDSGEIAIDESEIAEARWFGPDDALPLIPGEFSIAGLLVRANLPKAMS